MPKKRITMPSAIRLGGRTFKIEHTDGGFIGSTLGQYVPKLGKILLADGIDADCAKAVVLHEMFHDFDFQSTFELTEVQINTLSAFAFAALRDNPELVAWLMS